MPRRQIEGSDSPSCSVLILSCDRYQDLWTPFFNLFRRYWRDCELPVYLGTNSNRVDLPWVTTFCADDDEAWSHRLRFFLNNLDTNYVLVLLEDFFLDREVSNAAIHNQLDLLHELGGTSMRLFPNTPADYFQNGVGILHPGASYRVSLQATIWNRLRLLDLLADDESPWEFEIRGTQRSRAFPTGFYGVSNAAIHYRHVVERGEWFRSAAKFYAGQNIGVDFKARRIMGFWQSVKKIIINYLRRLKNKIHSRWLCIRYPQQVSDGR